MTVVFLLTRYGPYGDSNALGVFSSLELAQTAKEALQPRLYERESLYIERLTINAAIDPHNFRP